MSIYDFKVQDAERNEVSFADYKGKVLLIVNTATGCGFTPQYLGLQKLYDKYKKEGLEILDFPCNQFLGQAPGTNEEIVSFCQLKYGVTFKTFSKIDVNGKTADPLYVYLKEQISEDREDEETPKFKKILHDLGQALTGNQIKWNFTKFLVDRNGKIISRFGPTITPEAIEEEIVKCLGK